MRLSQIYYITLRSLFLFLVVLTCNGGIVYWLWNMKPLAAVIALLLSTAECALLIWWCRGVVLPDDTLEVWQFSWRGVAVNMLCGGLGAVLVWYLAQHAGDAAVRTPWAAVGWKFFAVYFVLMIVGLWGSVKKYIHPFGVSIILFVTFSVVLFLLPHGFGFDSHVHHATEKVIAVEGLIEPKQLYYNGHYALVVILQKLVMPWNPNAVALIDAFLVPLLAALIIPLIVALRIHKNALLPPFIGLFIVTTPQAFSYLLFLALAMVVWSARENARVRRQDLIWMCFLALATCVVHPLTGIPACGMVALRLLAQKKEWRAGFIAVCIFLVAAIPVLLLIHEYKTTGVFLSTMDLGQRVIEIVKIDLSSFNLSRFGHNYFTFWTNLIYGVQLMLWPVFFAGVWTVWRRSKNPTATIQIVFAILIALSSLIVYMLNKTPFVVNYEQGNYAGRLLMVSMVALIPLFFEFIGSVVVALRRLPPARLWFALIVLAAYGTCALYLAYPRVDRAVSTHAYSTRTAEYDAVSAIHAHAQGSPYAVLANQQVSAAALDVVGFKANNSQTYFKTSEGQSYFYPVPTGGALYGFYLTMVNDGITKKTALIAMDFMNVDRLYLVINDYWWRSKDLIAQARALGLKELDLPTAHNRVFVFER